MFCIVTQRFNLWLKRCVNVTQIMFVRGMRVNSRVNIVFFFFFFFFFVCLFCFVLFCFVFFKIVISSSSTQKQVV